MVNPRKILVIDDEVDVGRLIEDSSRVMGFHCISTNDPRFFLRELDPDTSVIFIDLMMPGIDGIELLRLLALRGCKSSVILMSGIGSRILETAEQLPIAHGLSIGGILNKPFRLPELQEVLTKSTAIRLLESSPSSEHLVSEEELEIAIVEDQLELHFQPQISVNSRDVIGVEALVRWRHPLRGLIFPDKFIPDAQKLGLIDRIGWVVYAKGMGLVREFANEVGKFPVLSVNVDPNSLRDLSFPDRFLALVERNRLSGANVKVEITENGLLLDQQRTLDVLARLRMKSICISIDDFGTGYAMMKQLRNVPATELKIDKSFVQNIGRSDRDGILVLKTIELGHDLGLTVVAEGVETQEQSDYLRDHHCDVLQGYLFTRPLPSYELMPWLRKYRSMLD